MIQSDLLRHLGGYIDGRWQKSSADGARLPVWNPANGSELAELPAMGVGETSQAIGAAQLALAHPASLQRRQDWLRAFERSLLGNAKEIARILTLEHGKPWKEAQVEVEYSAGFFRYCADHVEELASRTLEERPKGLRWQVHYRPAGVVALITPWNFPIAMVAKKLSAALAADCSCVIKPSTKTPLTMIALFNLLEALELPAGKVNLLIGPAGPIGDALCQDPRVSMISFTGSTDVGRSLIVKSAEHVKRLTLELGGNAPFIVFDDADLDAAADELMANKFRGSGQTCVCANRVYVQRGAMDEFARRVVDRVQRLRVGDGLKPDTDLGPLIDRSGYDKVRLHVQDALDKGATRLHGDTAPELEHDWGAFFPPTVLGNVTHDMICSCSETFGPLVPLLQFDTEEDAIGMANDTEFGLAAYFFTSDAARARRLTERLRFGHVGHNTGQGPTPEAPFGGMKQSGYGREGGHEGLFEFVAPQTVPNR